MSTWQAAEAQAHLSEVIDKALHEGPQTITDNGAAVIVLSEQHYRRLAERTPTLKERPHHEPRDDFIAFLLSGPKVDDFTIERDAATADDRDVEL